jgi:hypothetical protein
MEIENLTAKQQKHRRRKNKPLACHLDQRERSCSLTKRISQSLRSFEMTEIEVWGLKPVAAQPIRLICPIRQIGRIEP